MEELREATADSLQIQVTSNVNNQTWALLSSSFTFPLSKEAQGGELFTSLRATVEQ